MNQFSNLMLGSTVIQPVLEFIRSPENTSIYNATVLIVLTIVGIILCKVFVTVTKRIAEKDLPNPKALFLQLCRAHDLSTNDRQQLERLAALIGLETPAVLMIDASIWNIDELSKAHRLKTKQLERLQMLRNMLFEQPRLGGTIGLAKHTAT